MCVHTMCRQTDACMSQRQGTREGSGDRFGVLLATSDNLDLLSAG